MSVNPHVMSKMSYDLEKDIRQITNLYALVFGVYPTAVPQQIARSAELQHVYLTGQVCAIMGTRVYSVDDGLRLALSL